MRADEYDTLSNSTDSTNLLVDEFRITMETTGSDASWINVNNEIHNIIIHTRDRAVLLESDQHGNK